MMFTQNPCEPASTHPRESATISHDQKLIPLAFITGKDGNNDTEYLKSAIVVSPLRDINYRWVTLSNTNAKTQSQSNCVKNCSTKCGNDCKSGNILQSIKSKPRDELMRRNTQNYVERNVGKMWL